MEKVIKNLTTVGFEKYGYIIQHDSCQADFQVILSEKEQVGWRIAVSKISNKTVSVLGQHPNSMETFEPMSGTILICVAENRDPENYEVFLLDKPVSLFKNIWHAMISLSEVSYVKITENHVVNSEQYKLNEVIKIVAGS